MKANRPSPFTIDAEKPTVELSLDMFIAARDEPLLRG